MLKWINPTTGKIVKTWETHSDKGVEKIINATDKVWHHWRTSSFGFRASCMQNLASLLRSRSGDLAMLMSHEMGKVLREGISEIEKCAWVCEFYAQNAESFLQNEPIQTEAYRSFVNDNPWANDDAKFDKIKENFNSAFTAIIKLQLALKRGEKNK